MMIKPSLCSVDYRIDKDQQRRLVFQQGEGQYAVTVAH